MRRNEFSTNLNTPFVIYYYGNKEGFEKYF